MTEELKTKKLKLVGRKQLRVKPRQPYETIGYYNWEEFKNLKKPPYKHIKLFVPCNVCNRDHYLHFWEAKNCKNFADAQTKAHLKTSDFEGEEKT